MIKLLFRRKPIFFRGEENEKVNFFGVNEPVA